VMYVLDEPSIGLHQRDNDRLHRHARASARPRQLGASWSSMTRTRSARPTAWSTWARAPACTAARSSAEGTPDRDRGHARTRSPGQYLSGSEHRIAVPGARPPAERCCWSCAAPAATTCKRRRRVESRWACSPA
jgi:hypothetical protein